MPVKYLILAGPQAAGKSTLIQRLCAENPKIVSLEESRQIIVHKYQRKGAIFMTALDEIEVIHHDMTRMFAILGQDDRRHLYLDETSIFTIAHARAHGIELVTGYLRQYSDLIARFAAGILFIDVLPDVSWERRRHRYVQRLWDFSEVEREDIMGKYRGYLIRLYDELLKVYEHLDCPKIKIDGNASPDRICQLAMNAIKGMGILP